MRALEQERLPPVLVNPDTAEEVVLIRRQMYDKVRAFLRPLGRAWDNPADDDLIRTDV